MALENDDAALTGGEQTPAPVTPAPAEPAPHEPARTTIRRAYEQAQAKAAEKDEGKAQVSAQEQDRLRTPSREANDIDDPSKPTLDRTRDQQGRFVRGEGQEPAPAEKVAQETPEAVEPTKDAPLGVALRPPPGWSAAARAQFGMLPPEVREAVAKREADVATGMQVLQKYKGLETYTPMIEGSGISHAEFTKRAVEWEQSLKTNPVGTVIHVAKLAGVDLVALAQQIMQQGGPRAMPAYLRQTAQQVVQQAGQSPQYPEQAPQPDYRALAREEARQEFAERETNGLIHDFLSDPKHPHAEALADDMALLISNHRVHDLDQAYEMACWAQPEIRALLIREASANPGSVSETDRARRTASEARAAAKATVGAPSGPRPEPKDNRPANSTVRDDVRRAYAQHLEQT